jgi:hypothetical protein
VDEANTSWKINGNEARATPVVSFAANSTFHFCSLKARLGQLL